MPSITDTKGTEYQLRLTAPLIREIQRLFHITLTDLESEPLNALANDPLTFIDVLWILCRDQFTPDGSEVRLDEQFAALLPADVLDHASTALLEAVVDFFPRGKRSSLRSLAETLEAKRMKATELMLAKMNTEKVDERIVQKAVSTGMAALEGYLSQEPTSTPSSETPTSATSSTGVTESTPPIDSLESPVIHTS